MPRSIFVYMTFHKGARLDTSGVRKAGGTRGGVIGGGLGTIVVLFVLSQLLGVDLTSLVGVESSTVPSPAVQGLSLAEKCQTGEDANTDVECRMVGAANSLENYWSATMDASGMAYHSPSMELFTDQTISACGSATSAVGPFYCPADEGIYLDVGFFSVLSTQLGADEGSLAHMYVVAHEWGHHIQHITGTMSEVDRSTAGPTSDAVRLELQADCYAGAWAGQATTTVDSSGEPLLHPFTKKDLASALSATAAVGDDRIQAQRGQVTPETWTHGSAEQRSRWFITGMEGGPHACDTFKEGVL